ncbi:MAG TPA: SpoIIE family protein phosphatase, partial [Spirochaetia bacterium]|nr:SpoIIE family protein phosphatase [Spirochaetia bacterium]
AGLTYFGYERALVVDVSRILLFTKLDQMSVSVAILFGVMTVLELNYRRLPKRAWAYVGVFLCLSILVLAGSPLGLNMTLYYLFFGLTTLETIAAIVRRKPKRMYGGWILVAGFTVTAGFGLIQLLVDYGIVPGTPATVQSYAYGMLSLAVAMSLFLSYNFAHVNRDLARQVNTVSRLSDEALQQEKLASKLALERKTIEVEHERQAKELESARELQLSLLPKEVPRIDGLDIAAFMKTATEVGGDYYDFFSPREGALMVAIGDATGHGLRAGNMVTATKGLLHALAGMERLEDILGAANQAIKQMRLHMLTMCLALARIEGQRVSFSSAGMPPLLVWRAAAGRCERHVLKAMPLGAVEHFPFARMELTCERGDAIVLVSDGLFEVFDANSELYGMENVMKSFERHAGKPAEDVAAGLVRDVTAWGGHSPLKDDLTIVVVKFGPHGARP